MIAVVLLWALLIVRWAFRVWFGQRARPDAHYPLFVAGVCLYVLLTRFAGIRVMELRLKRTEITYCSVIAQFMLRPLFESTEGAESEGHEG